MTYSSCGSDFETYIAVVPEVVESLDDWITGCNDCGQCAICCGGFSNRSGIEVDLEPDIYFLLLSDTSPFGPSVDFGYYAVEVQCDPITDPTLEPTADPMAGNEEPGPPPTSSPTPSPSGWPDECNDRCDAYSVSATMIEDGVESGSDSADDDEMWIEYNVQRLFFCGEDCVESISFLVLNVCDGDGFVDDDGSGVDDYDLNGLICGFEIVSLDSDRRRMVDEEDRYSEDVWGVKSSGVYGIRIDHDIEQEMTFRLCVKKVFLDVFSDRVQFRRGDDKDLCVGEWVEGLPCLDETQFVHGAYSGNAISFGLHGDDYGMESMDRPQFTFYDILSANEQFICLAVVTIVGVGAFVSMFASFIEWKKDRNDTQSSYRNAIKIIHSDIDDGTHSVTDSDDEYRNDQ